MDVAQTPCSVSVGPEGLEMALTVYKLTAAQNSDLEEVTGMLSETGGSERESCSSSLQKKMNISSPYLPLFGFVSA